MFIGNTKVYNETRQISAQISIYTNVLREEISVYRFSYFMLELIYCEMLLFKQKLCLATFNSTWGIRRGPPGYESLADVSILANKGTCGFVGKQRALQQRP